jgi:hypothetical protein
MKVLSFNKLNLESIEVSNVEEDQLGNKVCKLNGSSLLFKVNDLRLKVVDGNYFIDSPNEAFAGFLQSFERLVIETLHKNSNEIFGKEFDLEKFESGIVSFVKEEGVLLNISDSSKFLNVLGDELVIENSEAVNGNFILNFESITFIKTNFHINLTVKLFQEVETEETVEESIMEEPEKVLEENFF